MSCCGSYRQQFASFAAARPPAPGAPANRRFTIVLEYVGATGLTAVGPASGRRYRFAGPGARLVIDPRDRPALIRIPGLREVA